MRILIYNRQFQLKNRVNEITQEVSIHVILESRLKDDSKTMKKDIYKQVFIHGRSALIGIRTGWRELKGDWTVVASIETCQQSKISEAHISFYVLEKLE